MFSWFKRKVELKNENSIMASTYISSGVKVGSEIIVPSNFKCLIYNNGDYYYGLERGKHKVSNDKFFTGTHHQRYLGGNGRKDRITGTSFCKAAGSITSEYPGI